MSTERLPVYVTAPPPANLGDLIWLRTRWLLQRVAVRGDSTARLYEWERLRISMTQLATRFVRHSCTGAGCRKCAEFYALLQILTHHLHRLEKTRGVYGQADKG